MYTAHATDAAQSRLSYLVYL